MKRLFKSFMAMLFACAMALTITACGQSEKQKVEATLDAYYQADLDWDFDGARSYCTPKMARIISMGEARLKQLSQEDRKMIKKAQEAGAKTRKYKSIKIDGDSAVVEVEGEFQGEKGGAVMKLKKIDNEWLIDGLQIDL